MKSKLLLTLAVLASLFIVTLGHAQDPFYVNQAVRLTRDAFIYQSSVSDAPIITTGRSGELAVVTSAYMAAADIRTNRGPLVWWCNVHLQRNPAVSGVMSTDDGSGQPGLVEVTPTGSFTMTWTPMQIRGDPQTLLTVNVSPSFSHDLYADYQTFVRISGTADWIPVGGKQAPHFETGRTYARFLRLPDSITSGATQPVPVDLRTTIVYQGNGETIATSDMGGAFVFFPTLPLSFATQPIDQLVVSNDPISLTASATGGTGNYTYSWKKNGVAIGVPAPAINIGHALLEDGTDFAVDVSDGVDTINATANVIVVNGVASALTMSKGQVTTVTAANGEGAAFQWVRNGVSINDGTDFSGTTTGSLTITSSNIAPAGVYRLDATLGGKTVSSGDITITDAVVPQVPLLLDQTFDRAMIGKPYQYQIAVSPDAGSPTKYTALGLPSGLTVNSLNGLISGTPKLAGRFNIRLSASNQIGTTPVLTVPLVIENIPASLVGKWIATMNLGDAAGAIGGRVDASITATGAVSGRLVIGVTGFAFTGTLNLTDLFDTGYAKVTIPIRRPSPMTPVSLSLHFDSATEMVDGWLEDDTETLPLPIGGWHCPWTKLHPATTYSGTFTFGTPYAVSVAGDAEYPQGCNYGTVSINASTGTATISARVADDTYASPIITTCPLGPNGDLYLYAARYLGYSATLKKNTANGCLLGYMSIANDGRGLDGALQWKKDSQIKASRAYFDGFSVQASIFGGRWVSPAKGQRLFGLQSDAETAYLGFSGTSLLDSISDPTIAFSVSSTNRVVVPTVSSGWNPCNTQLSIAATTGAFSGSFKLADPSPTGRTATFYGVLVCSPTGDQTGYGFFMAPMLPTPGQTVLTSPLMSGAVSITP